MRQRGFTAEPQGEPDAFLHISLPDTNVRARKRPQFNFTNLTGQDGPKAKKPCQSMT